MEQQTFKNKLASNVAMIAKADKGYLVVINNKTDYVNKMHSFLKNNKINKLPKDPTSEYNRIIKK